MIRSVRITLPTAFANYHYRTYREKMTVFKCPYCSAEYELTMARLSFQQRSYIKCEVCYQTMYSWNSRNVPRFMLMKPSEGKHDIVQTPATKTLRRGGLYDFIGRQGRR